jgi:hypothetical protein
MYHYAAAVAPELARPFTRDLPGAAKELVPVTGGSRNGDLGSVGFRRGVGQPERRPAVANDNEEDSIGSAHA